MSQYHGGREEVKSVERSSAVLEVYVEDILRQSTSWSDDEHRFVRSERHVTLKMNAGRTVRERHLYGEEAERFLGCIGLAELVRMQGVDKQLDK